MISFGPGPKVHLAPNWGPFGTYFRHFFSPLSGPSKQRSQPKTTFCKAWQGFPFPRAWPVKPCACTSCKCKKKTAAFNPLVLDHHVPSPFLRFCNRWNLEPPYSRPYYTLLLAWSHVQWQLPGNVGFPRLVCTVAHPTPKLAPGYCFPLPCMTKRSLSPV